MSALQWAGLEGQEEAQCSRRAAASELTRAPDGPLLISLLFVLSSALPNGQTHTHHCWLCVSGEHLPASFQIMKLFREDQILLGMPKDDSETYQNTAQNQSSKLD